MERMLELDRFTSGPIHIGAEQEICLVDKYFKPTPIGESLLKEINDEHFTTEIGRFNLELNLDPFEFTNDCLSKTEGQINELLVKLDNVARSKDASVILTGIVPTIRRRDLHKESIVTISFFNIR